MSLLSKILSQEPVAFHRPASVEHPVDLGTPVENPDLAAAVLDFIQNRGTQTEQELNRQLRRANFLVAVFTDEMHTKPGVEPGSMTVQKGSLIKMLSCVDDSGAQHLPLFFGWQAIRTWTSQPVSTLVMPAAQAWDFIVSQKHYAGAIVNPGENAILLPRSLVEYLRADSKGMS